MMLGEQLSIGHDPGQHVAYIGSWIKALKEDPREIFRAAGDAERISKYLLGREMQQEQVVQKQEPVTQILVPVLAVAEGHAVSNTPERVYLDVPYTEKEEAKALGAKWDRGEKSWFASPAAEPELLERWAKNRSDVPLQHAQDPQSEFAAALRSAGLILDSAPVMDGEMRRVRVEGDSKGQSSGAYVGHSDGHPAGYIKNYKTGHEANWKSSQRSQVISAKDRASMDAEAAERRETRAHEREVVAGLTAEAVAAHWIAGDLANEHPYLASKGVQAHGLRVNTLGALPLSSGKEEEPQQWGGKGELMIPVMDIDARFWAAQSIDDSGRKSFPRGSKLQGGHFVLGEPGASDELLIAEGYATGATLHELTGLPVVVAFHSGNLPVVAEAFRDKYPEKLLILAGDDDHTKAADKNVGRLKAEEAAEKVGGHTLFPSFNKDDSGSDWNDLVGIKGKDVVQHSLDHGIKVIHAKKNLAAELFISEKQKSRQPMQEQALAPEKVLAQSAGRAISR
jgi:putative DNA primase/helicase